MAKKPLHPYRAGPRLDSYEPHKPHRSLIKENDGRCTLPRSLTRITAEEHAAYERVWEEHNRVGWWTPKSQQRKA